MTAALIGYSSTFMRYAMAVQPRNYLLFGCHLVNFGAQATQGYRYVQHWQYVYSFQQSVSSVSALEIVARPLTTLQHGWP